MKDLVSADMHLLEALAQLSQEGQSLWTKHTGCLNGHRDKRVTLAEGNVFGLLPLLYCSRYGSCMAIAALAR